MPAAKKKKGRSSSAADKKKKPTRPTRCGPDFKWKEQPELITAIDKNNVLQVERLLMRGADPNEGLHHAIGRGKLQVADLLLRAGASIHTDIHEGDYFEPPPPDPKDAQKPKSGKKKGGKKKKGSTKKKKKK